MAIGPMAVIQTSEDLVMSPINKIAILAILMRSKSRVAAWEDAVTYPDFAETHLKLSRVAREGTS